MHSNFAKAAPQQARSRATRERILGALLRLLEAKAFDQISVAELTVAARCSMSSFYARFPTKDALFAGCLERFFEVSDKQTRLAFAQLARADRTLRQRVRGLIEFQLRSYRAHRGVLRALILHDRAHPEAGFGGRARVYQQQFFKAVAGALLAGRSSPKALESLRFGLWLVVQATELVVLFDDPIVRSEQRLIDELTPVIFSRCEWFPPARTATTLPSSRATRLTRLTRSNSSNARSAIGAMREQKARR